MGGFGSGRWKGIRTRALTSDYPRLDVRDIHRLGGLVKGAQTALTRAGSGRWPSSARLVASDDLLSIQNAGLKEADVPLRLDWTPCGFGGRRVWLLCPKCTCRCAVVYALEGGVVCRRCAGLAYASQREEAIRRAILRVEALEIRLWGYWPCADNRAPKPGRMHWSTFNTLLARLDEAESIAMDLLLAKSHGVVQDPSRGSLPTG